ncbi:hypothetical protein [Streptomyces sp. NPDC002402]
MPLTPPGPTPARSAADVDGEIRELWRRTGRVLTSEQRREYEQLLMEWARAYQAERAAHGGAELAA